MAGAFRNIGIPKFANEIVGAMQAAGYTVNESDPFEEASPISFGAPETSPYVNRMRMYWARMREDVLRIFPKAPGIPVDAASYLKNVEALYVNDAYNSSSSTYTHTWTAMGGWRDS
jgi:hypothetical protein